MEKKYGSYDHLPDGEQDPSKEKKTKSISDYVKTGAVVISTIVSLGFTGIIGYSLLHQKSPELPGYKTTKPITKTVALFPVNGGIAGENGGVTANGLVDLLNKAEKNKVDAYVFEINSGGGEVLPSKEIMEKIKEISETKYTIALIRSVGASGAYWIASACDTIVADETSFVGSIGVRMDYLQFKGLLDKIGVKEVAINAGEHKLMGSPYRELTAEETKILKDIVDESYELFVSSVAENRKMPIEKVKELATGQIYTGKQGFENGLVDQLGGRDEVSKDLEEQFNAGFVMQLYYEVPQTSIFGNLVSEFGHAIGEGIASKLEKDAKEQKIDYKF